jgi:hypothetical protein
MGFGFGNMGIGTLIGAKLFGTFFGQDFGNAYLINKMTGQGGFFKTMFADGLGSMYLGSRTNSAMMGAMTRMPFGAGLYGGPMALNPYMMNPYAMRMMPYSPMSMFGRGFWY